MPTADTLHEASHNLFMSSSLGLYHCFCSLTSSDTIHVIITDCQYADIRHVIMKSVQISVCLYTSVQHKTYFLLTILGLPCRWHRSYS